MNTLYTTPLKTTRTSFVGLIVQSIRPFWFWLILQVVAATYWSIDLSLRPYILKKILDKIAAHSAQKHELFTLAALYITFNLGLVLSLRLYDYTRMRISAPLKKYINSLMLERLLQKAEGTFHDQFSGSLGTKIYDIHHALVEMLNTIVDVFYSHFLALIIAIGTVFALHPRFGLLLACWAVILITGSFFLSKRGQKLSDEAAHTRSLVSGYIIDILTNALSIRLFNTTHQELKSFNKKQTLYVERSQKRDRYYILSSSFQGLSFWVYQSICLIWLIHGYLNHDISAGDVVLIISVNSGLINALFSLSKDISMFIDYMGQLQQGLRMIDVPNLVVDKPNAITLDDKGPFDIRMHNVHFAYPNNPALFHNLNAYIPFKQKVGLVGYSGSGKTTFIRLLLRLYDTQEGSIYIGKNAISSLTQQSLRDHITVVPQEPILFQRSIFDNIAYGYHKNISRKQLFIDVTEAAKKAKAHDFIMALESQYDTFIGERGAKLSGGQRQRIAIARAFLRKSPIIILDEATSQLDSVTEKDIQSSLEELMKGRTAIVIAHRLSTLQCMDRLLVFSQGKIIQDGNHDTLMTTDGAYKDLWQTQVGSILQL